MAKIISTRANVYNGKDFRHEAIVEVEGVRHQLQHATSEFWPESEYKQYLEMRIAHR